MYFFLFFFFFYTWVKVTSDICRFNGKEISHVTPPEDNITNLPYFSIRLHYMSYIVHNILYDSTANYMTFHKQTFLRNLLSKDLCLRIHFKILGMKTAYDILSIIIIFIFGTNDSHEKLGFL